MILFFVASTYFFLFQCSVDAGKCPVLVSKIEWDGLKPLHVSYLPRPVSVVMMKHTGTSSCDTDDACKDLVRSIQKNHMEERNYWDIGANFLVGSNGKAYEGAGWLHAGRHTLGYNDRSIAISFIGNYSNKIPEPEQLQAVRALIKCGVEQGHLTADYEVLAQKKQRKTG